MNKVGKIWTSFIDYVCVVSLTRLYKMYLRAITMQLQHEIYKWTYVINIIGRFAVLGTFPWSLTMTSTYYLFVLNELGTFRLSWNYDYAIMSYNLCIGLCNLIILKGYNVYNLSMKFNHDIYVLLICIEWTL